MLWEEILHGIGGFCKLIRRPLYLFLWWYYGRIVTQSLFIARSPSCLDEKDYCTEDHLFSSWQNVFPAEVELMIIQYDNLSAANSWQKHYVAWLVSLSKSIWMCHVFECVTNITITIFIVIFIDITILKFHLEKLCLQIFHSNSAKHRKSEVLQSKLFKLWQILVLFLGWIAWELAWLLFSLEEKLSQRLKEEAKVSLLEKTLELGEIAVVLSLVVPSVNRS